MVQQLRGVDCSGTDKSAAWKTVMRQLNDKVAKTGSLFSGKKGAGAEAARLYSFKAYSALSPAEQGEHSWSCSACAQSLTAQKIFGSAVLSQYVSGEPRHEPHRLVLGCAGDSLCVHACGAVFLYVCTCMSFPLSVHPH